MATDKKNILSLLDKYQTLLIENDKLRAEVETLKARLAALGHPNYLPNREDELASAENLTGIPNNAITDAVGAISYRGVNQQSGSEAKIELFMSLFKGRTDVYAKRWQNSKGPLLGGQATNLPARSKQHCPLNSRRPPQCNSRAEVAFILKFTSLLNPLTGCQLYSSIHFPASSQSRFPFPAP